MYQNRYITLGYILSALTLMFTGVTASNAYQPTMAYVENLKIDLIFDDAGSFKNGRAAVMIANQGRAQFAMINSDGDILFTADEINDLDSGVTAYRKDSLWGVVDRDGRIILQPTYPRIQSFKQGYAAFIKDGKWGFLNDAGEEMIPAHYDKVGVFSEGLAAFQQDGKWGYLNNQGQEVIAAQF
ncbi:MAG TPA: hypothetical protein DCQ49_00355, partial [Methylophaga sp.]|nr:hypothetical protein [Methylophaga sp.]